MQTTIEYETNNELYIRKYNELLKNVYASGQLNFTTDFSWPEISEKIITYFKKNNIKYNPSTTTAAFTVTKLYNGIELHLDIVGYLKEDGTFFIDFTRWSGDYFCSLKIFEDIKTFLDNKLEE